MALQRIDKVRNENVLTRNIYSGLITLIITCNIWYTKLIFDCLFQVNNLIGIFQKTLITIMQALNLSKIKDFRSSHNSVRDYKVAKFDLSRYLIFLD